MNKDVIKNIIVLSLIFGVITGALSVIPHLGTVILLIVLLLTSPIVITYMIMDNKFDLTDTKDSIITGAISGFSVNLSFSLIYCIIVTLMSKIFGIVDNFFLTSMIVNAPVWLIFVFIIFIGVLFGTTNAFTGFVTYYAINLIRDSYEKSNDK